VLFLSGVCVSVSGVLLTVGVGVCDLLIFLTETQIDVLITTPSLVSWETQSTNK